jgi:hypothetical protein
MERTNWPRNPCAILPGAEIRVLDGEVLRALVASFPGVEAHLAHSEDSTRWHGLGARCRQARGARGIRDVSVALGVPQHVATFTFSESTRGWLNGAVRIGNWPPASPLCRDTLVGAAPASCLTVPRRILPAVDQTVPDASW